MWSRAIFIAVICLLLILLVTTLAFDIRGRSPAWFTGAILLDLGIVLGGVKTILDTTKTAGDLVKLGFDVQKLQLEIKSLKRDEDKNESRVVIPTDAQVYRYGVEMQELEELREVSDKARSPGRIKVLGVLTALLAVGITLYFMQRRTRMESIIAHPEQDALDCGIGKMLIIRSGKIILSDVQEDLRPSHVVVRLPHGQISFPLGLSPGDTNKNRIYVANVSAQIRFRVDGAQIEIASDDDSTKADCSLIKEKGAVQAPK